MAEEGNDQHTLLALPVMAVEGGAKFRGRRNRRVSVSAEVDKDPNRGAYVKKVIPKTKEAMARIKNAVSKSFLFNGLNEAQRQEIYDSMTEVKVQAGERIIEQYADGDFFYVVESGKFDVLKKEGPKKGDAEEKKVFYYDEGGSFGELALMYNCPRAATVKATTDAVLWATDRATFRHIVVESSQRQRENYENFLAAVPILANLSKQERSQVADCLQSEDYKDGATILKEGQVVDNDNDKFYIIEEGECVAMQTPPEGGEPQKVGEMKVGNYFGERALITMEPRAASVIAVGTVKVCAMDRSSFERLLGPIREAMNEAIQAYPKAVSPKKGV